MLIHAVTEPLLLCVSLYAFLLLIWLEVWDLFICHLRLYVVIAIRQCMGERAHHHQPQRSVRVHVRHGRAYQKG
jgi:hypothetical protein